MAINTGSDLVPQYFDGGDPETGQLGVWLRRGSETLKHGRRPAIGRQGPILQALLLLSLQDGRETKR